MSDRSAYRVVSGATDVNEDVCRGRLVWEEILRGGTGRAVDKTEEGTGLAKVTEGGSDMLREGGAGVGEAQIQGCWRGGDY